MTSKNFKFHVVYKKTLIDAIQNALRKGKSDFYNIGDKNPTTFHDFHKAVLNINFNPIYIPHLLTWPVIGFCYFAKYSFNAFGLNSPITPEFLTHFYQDYNFDISNAVKVLKYKPVDTLKTISKLFAENKQD